MNKPSLEAETYWKAFLRTLPADQRGDLYYEAWGFGNSASDAEELGALVDRGTKAGTASLLWEYEAEDEKLPEAGDYSIILDGNGKPLLIIRTTSVEVHAFNQVSAAHACAEGEGDRSLEQWQEVHRRCFRVTCDEIGRQFDESMPIVCELFEVVHR